LLAFGYRWESNTQNVTDAVHVNHVTKCTLEYEPFYVARVGTPDYDERFIGYVSTRKTGRYVSSTRLFYQPLLTLLAGDRI
jgi:hypothetical protein